MDTPSIGRIVQIQHPSGHPDTGQPAWCAAIISWVDEDTGMIRANIQHPSGGIVPVKGVREGDGVGEWRWPPRVEAAGSQ